MEAIEQTAGVPAEIYDSSLVTSDMSVDWRVAVAVSLFKRDCEEKHETYRPVHLTSAIPWG